MLVTPLHLRHDWQQTPPVQPSGSTLKGKKLNTAWPDVTSALLSFRLARQPLTCAAPQHQSCPRIGDLITSNYHSVASYIWHVAVFALLGTRKSTSSV